MPLTKITTLDHQDLTAYSSLRVSNENIVVCDSEKVVLKALASNLAVISILGDPGFYKKHPQLAEQYNCYQAERSLLTQIVGHKMHQCVMAIIEKPAYVALESLGDVICILNGVSSPENVGNIIRSLSAFNITSLIIDEKSVTPYVRRAIRVSMGNIFTMKVHYTSQLNHTLKQLKLRGHKVIGSANEQGAYNITKYKFPAKVAFIIGSEGHGMEELIKKDCDEIVYIPITDHVLHLNANNAASIIAYECSTQLHLI